MEIPLNAQVKCTDGVCGRSVYVLINPVTDEVTHLVVREESSLTTEYIVPVEYVDETVANTIQLRYCKADLKNLPPFNKTTYIEETVPERVVGHGGGIGSLYYMPFVTPKIKIYEAKSYQQIPPGQLAVRRGTRVEATDGYVGNVDEFVVNPDTCHITHLVMREGHLWGRKDVIIPLSAMGENNGETVFLKIDKHQVESLPTFPLNRRWA
jgi:hypothetical protein